ncbi:MAG: anthranilate synthase component I [Candidatus Marinimicrobia bacterium]|jgi:anthranilate synthase component 1|nr:anthranilate synthase component I [Candidatus Neomarinimicrobiota bacterium]MBT4808753.1 anthranilate synthase component I [Candidatus Neomarinimicrobiota bacterium]MBT6128666.1 anthranilate synthase component I [Candidatus Neomarinimicrobiota bacterium]MBT6636784.1 anthranilate synthase component I [Candidatus Neomarinimicrobiota bacterium]MBT7194533.1 anthranilate synthase component I [Candidatus Neomarinimicrobiota bacterium]
MDKTQLTYDEFQDLVSQGCGTIPVYKRILADLLTPVAAWVHLSKKADYAFLLESVEKGDQYARYSYVGVNPQKIFIHKDGNTSITENGTTTHLDTPFLDLLRETQSQYNMMKLPGIPSFTGGLVGYLGYETIAWVEDIPTHANSSLDVPDAVFMLFEDMIAFDHLKGSALVISNVNLDSNRNLKEQFDDAHLRVDAIGESLHSNVDYQTPIRVEKSKVSSNFNQDTFESAVLKAKEHIVDGDIFQLVLSQRFERQTSVEPTTLYRALRTINPSPYMFHLKIKDFDIIGASPELLVKVEDGTVEIRPIAGTRQRGETDAEDKALADDLINDEKECAEHLMLLDLGRNDVGRVSEYGSVTIPENMVIENYSHVMHIVSDVKGKLAKDKDPFDALMSGFPAGTVTGAPKIRSMEIIHELEPDRRDIYSGAVGFFDFTGNVNTCITIRTMIMKNDTVHFQSGAGIVHDSDPTKEFEETVNKAKAIMAAIDFAENGLVEVQPCEGLKPSQGFPRMVK